MSSTRPRPSAASRSLALQRLDGSLLGAIGRRDPALALKALDAGADPEARELVCERYYRSALFHSLERESEPIARLLLERGADANKPTESKERPLSRACEKKNAALVGALLDHGADFRLTDGFHGHAIAAVMSYPEGFALLLARQPEAVADFFASPVGARRLGQLRAQARQSPEESPELPISLAAWDAFEQGRALRESIAPALAQPRAPSVRSL